MGTIFDVLITFNILLSYFWQLFWRSFEIGTIFCASGTLAKPMDRNRKGVYSFFSQKHTDFEPCDRFVKAQYEWISWGKKNKFLTFFCLPRLTLDQSSEKS